MGKNYLELQVPCSISVRGTRRNETSKGPSEKETGIHWAVPRQRPKRKGFCTLHPRVQCWGSAVRAEGARSACKTQWLKLSSRTKPHSEVKLPEVEPPEEVRDYAKKKNQMNVGLGKSQEILEGAWPCLWTLHRKVKKGRKTNFIKNEQKREVTVKSSVKKEENKKNNTCIDNMIVRYTHKID